MKARDQLLGGERRRMTEMRVERGEKGRTFVNDPDTGVSVTVDAALVSLGMPEPPLQVQIVGGKGVAVVIGGGVVVTGRRGVTRRVVITRRVVVVAYEQARGEALHHAGHVVVNRRRRAAKPEGDLFEVRHALGGRAGGGIEGAVDEAEVDDIACDLVERGLDRGEPMVDQLRELLQLAVARPPFFDAVQRWSESRTSWSASAIRRPGGSRGPP